MAWDHALDGALLERIAIAQEETLAQVKIIAEKQTLLEQHALKTAGHQENIDAHLAAIKEYQRCICECCTSGSMRSELLIETTMENSEKTSQERHKIYEQELSEAGADNLTGD